MIDLKHVLRGTVCDGWCLTTVDAEGHGSFSEPRLHQLIRQPGSVTERTFEITFVDPGVQVYAFTFG